MTAVMSKNKEKIHYMASGRTIATNFKADLKEYRRLKDKLNWTDFDSFKDMQSRFWELCLMEDKDNWTFSTCNCREFQKNYICKHLLLLACRYEYTSIPLRAQNMPLGPKQKRGRPTEITFALEKMSVPVPKKRNTNEVLPTKKKKKCKM